MFSASLKINSPELTQPKWAKVLYNGKIKRIADPKIELEDFIR